jgi:hypothetical protein
MPITAVLSSISTLTFARMTYFRSRDARPVASGLGTSKRIDSISRHVMAVANNRPLGVQ